MDAVPDTVKLYGKVKIGDKAIVGEYTIIGYGVKSQPHEEAVTIIGNECIIGSHIVIYKGGRSKWSSRTCCH